MHIKSLKFRGYRGFGFDLKFMQGMNVLIGTNGCGKTTVLEIIAGLTGNDLATNYVANKPVEMAEVVVEHKKQRYRLSLEDRFDTQAIQTFKAQLPHRTSFVLTHDIPEHRLVTEQREPIECQKDMLAFLDRIDLGFSNRKMHFKDGHGATMMVGPTGGQRYLLDVGMRRAPTHIPCLVENPDRHLHVGIKRMICRYYQASKNHQVIYTTHDPCMFSGVEHAIRDDRDIWREDPTNLLPGIIDMSSDRIKI